MVKETINRLYEGLNAGITRKAEKKWGGADVCIVRHAPPPSENGFYPDPRFVETRYPLELSWIFEALRDAFYAEKLLDGCSKIEFFGRLANAACEAITENAEIPCVDLCKSVIAEAEKMYEEMQNHQFHCLAVTFGNEIYNDRCKK